MNRRQLIGATFCMAAAYTLPSMQLAAGAVLPRPSKSEGNQVLRIVRRTIEVKRRAARVFGLVRSDGVAGLSLPAGGSFNVTLRNEATEPSIIHWHGLTPPWAQDGVANAPMPLLDSEREFDFPVGPAGTHWMHAHTLQEQSQLAAPLIVFDPTERSRDEQEVVILLHDFSFSTPEELLARLQGAASALQHSGATHEAPRGAPHGASAAAAPHLNDIEYDAYLSNDRTLDDPEVVKVEAGGRVRLRIINGATATAFTIDLGDIEGSLIAVDGQDIVPMKGRRFPVAMGQRLDIQLELPRRVKAFPILALREGASERTGIVLAPPAALVAKLPSEGTAPSPVVDLAMEQLLHAVRTLPPRQADKQFNMALVGGTQGYIWGLETNPEVIVRRGDRVEVTMTNASTMAHPMHLHGHHFQVVAIDGRRFAGAVRDTVHIPPRRSVTIAFDATNFGQWAFHCHHLYHMATGMMTTVKYDA